MNLVVNLDPENNNLPYFQCFNKNFSQQLWYLGRLKSVLIYKSGFKQTNSAYTTNISGQYRINIGDYDSTWTNYPINASYIVGSVAAGLYKTSDPSFTGTFVYKGWGLIDALNEDYTANYILFYF